LGPIDYRLELEKEQALMDSNTAYHSRPPCPNHTPSREKERERERESEREEERGEGRGEEKSG